MSDIPESKEVELIEEGKKPASLRGKIRTSRLLKYSLIIIFLLACLWLISTLIITYLTSRAMEVGVDENVRNMIEVISEFIKIDVSGAIGTIATAIIARYGLREVSANIKGKDYNSEDSD